MPEDPTSTDRDLWLDMLPQPDDITCGPTCLHAVYRFYEDDIELDHVIRQVPSLKDGGTLGVLLGLHALRRGYDAILYSFNLGVLDPVWFANPSIDLAEKLRTRRAVVNDARLVAAIEAYTEFVEAGGELRQETLSWTLLRKLLQTGAPVLTGLSATFLYGGPREIPSTNAPDDIRGEPAGHFVVIKGYDERRRRVSVADPYLRNPIKHQQHYYDVDVDRAVNAILLGVLTYDGNLLIVRPRT